eukprot:CAMPEP_0176473622 /NCGR_PEP_ID=MMETSP0127-20121128/42420_1 /TAXON_ID=938130 /ORGANISM="Platyophrya macrostoma, Strain WH" /LENGTH=58 /DNA_ID=CAMNT_0017868661 /DNA_START=126 /DNA_END=299 /DNA_ORIENTATION=+
MVVSSRQLSNVEDVRRTGASRRGIGQEVHAGGDTVGGGGGGKGEDDEDDMDPARNDTL